MHYKRLLRKSFCLEHLFSTRIVKGFVSTYNGYMDEYNQAKITELINKSEIVSVVNSYFRALDEKNFDIKHFATIFTGDAQITRPNGASIVGPEEISASHQQSFTRFEGTQHLLTGHDVSIIEHKATVSVNLVAMHLWQGSNNDASKADNFFLAGGIIDVELLQSERRWKVSLLSNTNIWRAGVFKDMAQTK
jgi:hypothetical protein